MQGIVSKYVYRNTVARYVAYQQDQIEKEQIVGWIDPRELPNSQISWQDVVSIVCTQRDYYRMNMNGDRLLDGARLVSVAVDLELGKLGVFRAKGDERDLKTVQYSPSSDYVYVSITAWVRALGLPPGRYGVEKNDPEAFFTISHQTRLEEGPDDARSIVSQTSEKDTEGSTRTLPGRLLVCKRFIEKMDRPVQFKDRHSGYQLTVPGGRNFGFVRFNIKGRNPNQFVVYVQGKEADIKDRFDAQLGNPNDCHFFFDPEDEEKANYAIETLRRAYDRVANSASV